MKLYETTIIYDPGHIHIKHKSPPSLIAEMDRRFRLNEGVLRHLTVLATKESPKTAEEGAKTEEGAERTAPVVVE